ncbi:MAG: hypothetical protein ACOZIN_03375 [Myxococcota bacterium]
MKVGEKGSAAATGARPATPERPAPTPAPASTGWIPKTRSAPPQSSFGPAESGRPQRIGASAAEAVKGLSPSSLPSVDPLQALDAVKDGTVTLNVPLQPGKHTLKGVSFEVEPGTVMKVQVQVRDGKIVAARDEHGRDTGEGTKVEIHPPIDLPLWVSGNGAYVRDQKGAQVAFQADLGGMLDMRFKSSGSSLSEVVRAFDRGNAQPAGSVPSTGGKEEKKTSKSRALPAELFAFDRATFSGEVSLKDKVIEAGGLKVDLAPGTRVQVQGNAHEAELAGQVQLDGLDLKQDGVFAAVGRGSATIRATFRRADDGTMHVSTRVSEVDATIQGLESVRPGAQGQDPDRFALGPTRLKNGVIELDSTVRLSKEGRPEVQSSSVRARLEVEGSLLPSKLSVRDGRDDASLAFSGGRVQGTIELGPEKTGLDVEIDDAMVEVKDLQTESADAALDLHHARAEGKVRLQTSGGEGAFNLEVEARKIDVQVDDLRARRGDASVDLAKSTVTGAGTLKANSGGGFSVEGDLRLHGQVDDLQLRAQEQMLDVAAGSNVDLQLSRLTTGKDQGLNVVARGRLDVGLDQAQVKVGGAGGVGKGRLRGTADVHIGETERSVELSDAHLSASAGVSTGRLSGTPTAAKPKAALSAAPAGVRSVEEVSRMSAKEIAGGSETPQASGERPDLRSALAHLRSGKVELEVPIEGHAGLNDMLGVTFEPGTKLQVSGEVVDGKLVPDTLKVRLSRPADGPGWIELKGAYLDKEHTLRLDLAGMHDFAVPGMERLPMQFDAFLDRVAPRKEKREEPPAPSSGPPPSAKKPASAPQPELINTKELQLTVSDATFRPGPIHLPGGTMMVTEKTKLSLTHGPQKSSLSGRVDFSSFELDRGGVAVGTGKGSAQLTVNISGRGETRVVEAELKDLTIDTQYAVQKRANGDYLHLAEGRIEKATISIVDRPGDEDQIEEARMDIPRFSGTIGGGRMTVMDAGGTSTIELGRAKVDGRVRVEEKQIHVRARVEELDVAVRDYSANVEGQRLDLARGRLKGSGTVDVKTGEGFSVDADVRALELEARELSGARGGAKAQVGRTTVRGSGRVQLDSKGDLRLDGDLEVDSELRRASYRSVTVSKDAGTVSKQR